MTVQAPYIPEVSISKLKFDHEINADNYIETIKNFVQEYNERKCGTGDTNEVKWYKLIEEELFNCGISLLIYGQIAIAPSKALQPFLQDVSNYDETKYNVAIFYYCKENSVFVVTTNMAYLLIKNIQDSEFPIKIAKRLLDEKGMKNFGIKPLFTRVANRDEIRKAGNEYKTDPIDEPSILKRFQGRLRRFASIRKLNCFAKQGPVINVEILPGSVRFKAKIKTETFPKFIEHLNKIDTGVKTKGTDGKDEDDTDAFRSYTEKVQSKLKDDLEYNFCNSLKKCIQGGESNFLKNFEMMHKETTAFLNATEFKIFVGKKWFNIAKVPTLKLILKIIQSKGNTMFQNIQKVEDVDAECSNFQWELDQIAISFKHKSRSIKQVLLKYMEGILSNNGQIYYRENGDWYFSSQDYFRLVHKRSIICLQKYLKPREQYSATLTEVWNDDDDEGVYNDQYMAKSNFLVGDKSLTKTMEIFDLLRHDDNRTYLYHVKKGFTNSARIAQEQLCNSVLVVTNHFRNHNRQILRDLYNRIKIKYDKNTKKIPEFCDSFDKFQDLFDRTKMKEIVFVYAVKSKSEENDDEGSDLPKKKTCKAKKIVCTLALERQLKVAISTSEIKDALEKIDQNRKDFVLLTEKLQTSDYGQLSKLIFDRLVQLEYIIDSDEEKGSVSSSMIWADAKNFKYSTLKLLNKMIYAMLRPYRTYFTSLSAKLSIDKMRAAVERHSFQFRICDIRGIKGKKKIISKKPQKLQKLKFRSHKASTSKNAPRRKGANVKSHTSAKNGGPSSENIMPSDTKTILKRKSITNNLPKSNNIRKRIRTVNLINETSSPQSRQTDAPTPENIKKTENGNILNHT